ncbi:hypothetical protein FACS189483_03410 [Spirochaetia bacterium]|nr:hypothetical protein FACS189483_03410 [Spirochaetia bacterium]
MKKTVGKLAVLAVTLAVVMGGCTNPFFRAPYAPESGDTTPPAFSSAAVDGTSLVITLSEAAAGTPNAGDFIVSASNTGTVTVSSVSVSGDTVTLVLSPTIVSGETVTVAYSKPTDSTKHIQDAAGNALEGFGAQSVSNTTGGLVLETTPNAAIDFVNETLTGFANGTYSFNSGANVLLSDSTYDIPEGWMTGTVNGLSIVKKGNGTTTTDSAAQRITIPARPAAPGVTLIPTTSHTVPGNTGGINGTTAAMEYKLAGASTWTSVTTGSSVTGLATGNYSVRVKATIGSFKSEEVSITISPFGAALEVTPTAVIDYVNEKLTGLTASANYTVNTIAKMADGSGAIAIENAWFGTMLAIKKTGDGTTTADSTVQSLPIPARPGAPGVSGGVGVITGATAAMEYSANGTSGWTAYSGSVAAGTYYVRVKQAGSNFAGTVSGAVVVSQKTLTNSDLEVTGSVTTKTYDGNTTATGLTIAIKAASKMGADTVGITGISYAFASADANNSAAIAFSGTPALSGAQAANYTLSGINLSAAPFAGITGIINKAAGAAVSGAPTVSGTPTFSSITVNAVTPGSGTQTVEYAISTSSGSTPASGWQDSTAFSGLAPSTSYYVYARTKANGNYNAGTAQQSAAISTVTLVVVAPSVTSIAAKFGIDVTTNSAAKVTEVFTALHAYLATNPAETGSGTALKLGDIALGDYIDLAGLTVARYHTAGSTEAPDGTDADSDTNLENGAISFATNPTITANSSTLLRLIVVGINAYSGKNGNGTDPHLVFQFQNVPGNHRMNPTGTNVGGYAASEMRTYLTGNFLTGLTAAGVPASVLWAPKRIMWNGFTQAEKDASASSSTNTAVDTIEDALFLPTEWEMFGSRTFSHTTETNANQGRLEYYAEGSDGNTSRRKYISGNMSGSYTEVSPRSSSAVYFARVSSDGYTSYGSASAVGGCAPAFCVK